MSTSTQPTVPASRFVDKLGDYLSVDELAQYLQLSKETIYHWRLEGTSIFRRIDGSYGTLRIRATSKARARRTLIEAVGEEYEAAHATGDGLTPDSFFVELAHEYMEQTAFTGDQRVQRGTRTGD
ncbi:DNA-binding protein [Agromyces fucosus]|uniref:DNA-binding protein n=1 Tax=Agromyces fucosus TaxID=41985 RepID=A0A4V1QT46_9MICO|nr:helix-turn-helix domain-containing protein [Agromyces fucosus]RXZ50623.1 DNA-binding protein [Agromyces fucosus]